jgi:hypothetical protein
MPTWPEYVPAGQAEQTDPPVPVKYVPAKHWLQDDGIPVPLENVPAPQAWQVLLRGMPEPVLYVPAAQATHLAELSRPSPVPYVPEGQLEQSFAPM